MSLLTISAMLFPFVFSPFFPSLFMLLLSFTVSGIPWWWRCLTMSLSGIPWWWRCVTFKNTMLMEMFVSGIPWWWRCVTLSRIPCWWRCLFQEYHGDGDAGTGQAEISGPGCQCAPGGVWVSTKCVFMCTCFECVLCKMCNLTVSLIYR